MFRVLIYKGELLTNEAFYNTKEEAENWITQEKKKGSWGKNEEIMVVTQMVKPMELIEEVTGPLGMKAYKVRLPAEYEVIIEEVPEIECNLSDIQKILSKTDWLFISDVPLDKESRVEFKKYREYLRKLPRTAYIENFESWLRRTRPEYFMEGRQGPKMVQKFNTYL